MNIDESRIKALEFLANRYIENVWKHSGLHLVALGWILASSQLHVLIASHLEVRLGLTFIFLFMEAMHFLVNKPIYDQIKSLTDELTCGDMAPIASFYSVSKSRFLLNEIFIFFLAIFAVVFIWAYPRI